MQAPLVQRRDGFVLAASQAKEHGALLKVTHTPYPKPEL